MPTPSGVGIFIYSKSGTKRAALYPNKKLIECGYFEAGRRRWERSILDVCEHPNFKPDAKRTLLYNVFRS